MKLKNIIWEDFVNYKEPSMFLAFPSCTFKCGREYCQNAKLLNTPIHYIDSSNIIDRYNSNPITKAIVCGGMEPFDSFDELEEFIYKLRFAYHCNDVVVIYTGYTEDEVGDKLQVLKPYKNIIIKFGRYIPNREGHYNELLGVVLASENQYAKKIS